MVLPFKQITNLQILYKNYTYMKDLVKLGPMSELDKILQLPFDAELPIEESSLMDIARQSKNEEVIEKLTEHQSKFNSDKSFMLAGMQWDGMALGFAPRRLRKDRDIVLAAVQQNGMALEFAHPSLKKIEKLCLQQYSKMAMR